MKKALLVIGLSAVAFASMFGAYKLYQFKHPINITINVPTSTVPATVPEGPATVGSSVGPVTLVPFVNAQRYFGCQTDGGCDLGTTTHRFRNMYITGAISGGSSSSMAVGDLTFTNATGTNLTITNALTFTDPGIVVEPLNVANAARTVTTSIYSNRIGINSSSPNASLVVKGVPTTNVVNFTSSTNNSLFKILTNGYAGLNVNTPQAVFDVRDITPTTTGGIFQVANASGNLAFMFVSSTATTIRGMAGAVNFELGVSTDNGNQVILHGDNATVSSDSTKALVINGKGNLYLQANSVNRMLISATGLIGVNTTTQLSLFTIQGRVNEDPFAIASTTGGNMLKILKNGNVGFGTSTPIANLAVASGITTTITVGYPGVGKVCQWNGASWTITAYASNSITPIITTSTACN